MKNIVVAGLVSLNLFLSGCSLDDEANPLPESRQTPSSGASNSTDLDSTDPVSEDEEKDQVVSSEENGGGGAGGGGEEEELEPLPDSVGLVSEQQSEDASQFLVTLTASKSYGPSSWADARYPVPKAYELELPATLSVVGGRSGNHLAFVRVRRENPKDGLVGDFQCVYYGIGSNTSADYRRADAGYQFDFCAPIDVTISPAARASIRDSSGNILTSDQRAAVRPLLSRGDIIELHVSNGNRKSESETNITTTVEQLLVLFAQ